MKTRFLFTVLTIVMGIGESISLPQATSRITTMAVLGLHPANAASWGEVQAKRFVEVSSPSDSTDISPLHKPIREGSFSTTSL